ncbi:MAG TPA: dienelactone hydrolase family protein [Allosphingosinicella sp.]|nr:dienelactone hydrolase family protein [Allosphingosinicella sp.]
MDLEPISYQASDRPYTGFLADGSRGAPAPGVLVIHEGGGLTGHAKASAAMLAEQFGMVAFAMDLFGAPAAAGPGDVARLRAIVQELRADVAELRARVTAALAVLAGHRHVDPARLAAIGYCFGGAAAIELARTGAPLAALAGFHAGVLPGENEAIRAKVLLCHGEADPVIPAARIQAFVDGLSAAGVDWQLHLYGGVGHSFTNPEIDTWNLPGFRYDAAADARSWAALRQLLGEAF